MSVVIQLRDERPASLPLGFVVLCHSYSNWMSAVPSLCRPALYIMPSQLRYGHCPSCLAGEYLGTSRVMPGGELVVH